MAKKLNYVSPSSETVEMHFQGVLCDSQTSPDGSSQGNMNVLYGEETF